MKQDSQPLGFPVFTDQNLYFSFGLSAPQGRTPCGRDPRRWAIGEIKLQRAHSCAPCPRPLSLRRSQRESVRVREPAPYFLPATCTHRPGA